MANILASNFRQNTFTPKEVATRFSSIQFGWIFTFWVALYLICTLLTNFVILTNEIMYRGLAAQMPAERIAAFIEMRISYSWIHYISPIVIVFCKTGFTAICLSIGLIIVGQDIQISYILKIALVAEGVFVLAMAVQVFGAMYLIEVRIPDDYANFAPLSALQFFDVSSLKLWMKHPLRTLNLFEVAYMLVLAYFLTPLLKKRTYWQTLGLVGASYGLGLLLWVVALAFLLLQVS